MKSSGQKLKLLHLKDLFEKETDDQHGVTMARILEYLAAHDVTAERKSIYDDIRLLQLYGIDIVGPQNREYALASREFELAELKMMIDSIQASKFLSEAKTKELIKKLENHCSIYEAQTLQRTVITTNRVKNMNTSIHRNVDTIHAAMSNDSQIQFQYFDYDLNKQRKYRKNGGKYTVSPFAMIYADDNYYLLAFDAQSRTSKFKHYRVDKMERVETTGAERMGKEEFEKIDLSSYTKYTFSMFGGEIVNVTMRFANHMLGAVMDRFGKDVMVRKEDDRHFLVTVPVAVSQQFFGWVFGLGNQVQIVEPEEVRKKMKKALAEQAALYNEEVEGDGCNFTLPCRQSQD